MCVMGLGQCAPPVPHRPVGRAGGGRGPGFACSFANVISRSIVAPYGGARRALRHQPGAPSASRSRTSRRSSSTWRRARVAQGKMRVAHNKGEKAAARAGCIDDKGNPDGRPEATASSSPSARYAPSACTRATAWPWSANCSAARSPAAAPGTPTTARKKRVLERHADRSSSTRTSSAPRRPSSARRASSSPG